MNFEDYEEAVRRSQYLGSSDIANILGVGWNTPVETWKAKVYPETVSITAEQRKRFRRGHLLEPVIRQMAVEDYSLTLTATNYRYTDREHMWMRAEVDFEYLDSDGFTVNADAKSVYPMAADRWGEAGTDEIPAAYHAQFQFAMMVTGRQRTDVYALFGTEDLVRYVVHRDDETIADIRAAALKFWNEHVLTKIPPPPKTVEDVVYLMGRIPGRRITADEQMLELFAKYDAAKRMEKSSESAAEDYKLQLTSMWLDRMVNHDDPIDRGIVLVSPSGQELATYRKQTAARIDVERLRSKAPDVAAEFTKPTDSWVLRRVKPKK